ncbi:MULTISPECIES: 3-ketosteroid-delta-1-dehydrogenase [Mycobacterium avium complex (MAC)]|uniref:3-ketosteroid-delta-1-dehydrogenase n=2 Tax=Mycobacterium avium complex (MAC) TaxID=120793 RepID=A0AAW5SD81_MYCBC|nr:MULTISPECIES: 3-ketosteroid-delta-1-dehydrogenase [Mycobacterium avium complex (MAC)]ETA95334.1 3-ketosteroid-delta-1-dehydrogenase [Mycobacterium avium 05-4293]ETZ51234.1 3-oxosteroid 1-dehydrogenase [Mycobacterium avium MAV_061107_1842]KDO99102.1 3-ketosteroid-delta-1-dehydrogenase [Mycobacterium avium subsp. hominissuis 3388]MBZ4551868.1 3-ketosteroid-delta-1-dehydrogenase [Mycobacterium avium subsp. hominissuis]MBZ4582931.1 3-ketosteroid-delta-1-dehydrogenase [Mycobacterium avium subsp.
MTTHNATIPAGLPVADTAVDLLVVGSGTGMAAALAAHELGLSVLIVEKSSYVGGSTARSGGALWLPASPVLDEANAGDTAERAGTYLDSVVAGSAPPQRSAAFVAQVSATVEMLRRTTPLRLFWARDYSDYHPEEPGGSAAGRTCECRPFDTSLLGEYRTRLEPGLMEVTVPMPTTGADYRWMNLVARLPRKGIPVYAKRLAQGVGGRMLGRRYAAGGQGLMAGLFTGVLRAGIPIWTGTTLTRLTRRGERVSGAVVEHGGREVTISARRGVVLATGGFDHRMEMRWKFQSESLGADLSLGAAANTGDGIRAGQEIGAAIDLMDQAWWFPAVAPLPGKAPAVMLAERSLPGCLIVDQHGRRFVNEATDYMSFGQRLLELERSGSPVESMWIVFDQQYRNSYVFGAELFPRMRIPQAWYDAGIAVRADNLAELGAGIGVPVPEFVETMTRFNQNAAAGEDPDFGRGRSAYDRYYGDPTIKPNPNLRPLVDGPFYAVRMVLSDLGTCGGLKTDERARVLREDGGPIAGLYAIGNTAANAFGTTYPGAGATIAQGLVYGYIAAQEAARPSAAQEAARPSASQPD